MFVIQIKYRIMKKFQRPDGHNCNVSSTISEDLSFGNGELDDNGFWQYGCYECARAHEKQFPESGKCWPYSLILKGDLNNAHDN